MKYFSHILLSLCIVIIGQLPSFSQMSGHINYEPIGLEFDIPNGWFGQEMEDMIVLGSNSTAGMILMMTHQYSIGELTQEAKVGFDEGGGTTLKLAGQVATLSKNAVGGEYTGTMEWEPVRAYVIGVANPYGTGPGVTIMSVAQKGGFTDTHRNVCKQIFQSIKFTKIDRTAEIREWKEWLGDNRLTYMDSYYSSSSTPSGVSGGYDSKTIIDLCSKGYFNFNSNSSITAGNSGASVYSKSGDQGQGAWDVTVDIDGSFMLVLNYHNGEKRSYKMKYEDSKFYLDDYRYFVTSEGEYAPNCPR